MKIQNSNNIPLTPFKGGLIHKSNGVALVAVLAVLVILAILASSFSVMMDIENKQSKSHVDSQQLDMILDAGLEHTKALLADDEMSAAYKNKVGSLSMTFSKANLSDKKNPGFSSWIFVENQIGKVVGRYRFRIEDEAAKVNVSKAWLLKDGKGTSWDTGEVNLPRALGLPTKFAKKIIRYRYGANWMPGGRNDDDHNNTLLMTDGIDNDADGEIDEEDEGINDPKEYSSENLSGDDRKFSSMMELVTVLTRGKNKLPLNVLNQIKLEVPRRATVYSYDIPGSPTLLNKIPSDINCITPRECRKLLIKANSDTPFESNSEKQRQIAANLIDYRDENHVLSTIGSTYGVEAICFNEVLANDASFCVDTSVIYSGNLHKDYWTDNCGSIDGERMAYLVDSIYNAVPDDPQKSYSIDPRKAWRISSEKNIGKLDMKNGKVGLEFPDAIGKNGNNTIRTSYYKYNKPEKLPGNKPWCTWDKPNDVVSTGQDELYEDLLNVLGKLGKADKNRPDFSDDYFKHSLVMLYKWSDDLTKDDDNKAIGCFEIIGGDEESIVFNTKEYYSGESFVARLEHAEMSPTDYDLSATINSWSPVYPIACVPKANRTYLLRARQPKAGQYFKVMVGRPAEGRYTTGYPDELAVSGRIGGPFENDKDLKRQWVCNEGKPIRTKSDGWMEVLLTSSPEVNRDGDNKQFITYLRVVGTEVVEMYNASATPVSLANWRIICNTGSLATQIGKIRNTSCYDQKLRKSIVDQNPVVQPKGHFYLVNDTKLFDYTYGSGNGKWGGGPKEEIPLFKMDEQNWGVSYKIKKTSMLYHDDPQGLNRSGYSIIIEDKTIDKEVFNLETIKFVDKKGKKDRDSWNNIFAPVLSKFIVAKGEIFIRPLGADRDIKSGKLVGKSIMILGLPHSGGIVSLTLKNEYDQVCARTVDYGEVDVDELDYTTEKIDPTKNTWVKRRKSSIGGDERKAENRAMRSRHNEKFFIKNGPYCSIGEAKNISTGNDFERLGGDGNISKGADALGALANVMCSSHVRLESCSGNIAGDGWKKAEDEVANSSKSSVTCKNGNWEPDQWKGQTLRFITGKLRGEKFPISGNSKNVIAIGNKKATDAVYSAPNRFALSPEKGDKFSLGPGYSTPLCFTRRGGKSAEWTWKNALPNVAQSPPLKGVPEGRGMFNIYIYGLNDAIDTTEFFEENNNASINVEVWNYKTKSFDKLKKRGRYGKQDSFNAGKISPDNISENGDFRLKLTAYDVTEKNTEDKTGEAIAGTGGKQTGMAWFNYAVITPVPVPGRVNINTASPRLLASLPGINTKLAKNIFNGIDKNNKKNLKPYQKLGDVLKVKGMTPATFERCANLLALDSNFFTVEVEAQIIKNQTIEPGMAKLKISDDEISGSRQKRFVIELTQNESGYVNICEKENYPVK